MAMEISENTHLCSPINSAMLKVFSQRINRCRMSIVETGDVSMEMIGKAQFGSGSAEITKELVYISSDGMKVLVYQNAEGVHCASGIPLSGSFKEYIYPDLPSRLWKKYIHAYKFVEVVKSKTPRIVLMTDQAKCKLMENVPAPDFEAHFHDGTRILLSKEKIHITEAYGGTMILDTGCLKDRVMERTMHMIAYTTQCQIECTNIHESLIAIQARDSLINVFPATIGTMHNPFYISQITGCEPSGYHCQKSPQTSSHSNSINAQIPLAEAKHENHLNNSEDKMGHHRFQVVQSMNCDLNPKCYHSNFETQAFQNDVPFLPSNTDTINDQGFDESNSPAELQPHSQQSYLPEHIHANNNKLSNSSHNTNMMKQESFPPLMRELDLSNQSNVSLPISPSCQSENVTCYPRRLSETNLKTPTKCQTKNNTSHCERCVRVQTHTSETFHDTTNAFPCQPFGNNICAEHALEDCATHIVSTNNNQPSQLECHGAIHPDLTDKCYSETNLNDNIVMNARGNACSNVYTYSDIRQQSNSTLQHKDTVPVMNSFNEPKSNKQSLKDYDVLISDNNEMNQIIHKMKNVQCLSVIPGDSSCSPEKTEMSVNSAQFNVTASSPQFDVTQSSPYRHGAVCMRKEEASSNGCFTDNPEMYPSESYLESLPTNNLSLQPPLSLSPKKLSRKIATPSTCSINLKSDNFYLAPIDENQQVSMTAMRNVIDNDGTNIRDSLSSFGSECSGSNSNRQHNTSLPMPSSFSGRKGINVKHYQDKFNTSLPHCVSSSPNQTMTNFPLSPQKEFIQGGGRECQSMDSTLPPQVRNSLDMSISSYYSDSPSSSPSSSCDPVYQVFVPYTGWASYYNGGAIWVLYNDGTQLGVKATEAAMTFIDQDGTQKRYKNSDVVPDIVKMKLERLPNILRTVMTNKDNGNA